MTTAIEFVWRAMGEPNACESDGTEMRPRAMQGARCAATGLPAEFRVDDALSDKFTTVTNRARWLPYGGDALHRSAVWACKALAFRCGAWFARADGVWPFAIRPLPGLKTPPRLRPCGLDVLLQPPAPPFVAALPLYGINHGGEMHVERAIWWRDGKPVIHQRPLIKLQSKHTLLYTRVSASSDRYHLQVDDAMPVVVDVAAWRAYRKHADELLEELRASGVGATDARTALLSGACPRGTSLPLARRWPTEMRPFDGARGATWWPLFVELLRMPELSEQTRKPSPREAAPALTSPPPRPAPTPPSAAATNTTPEPIQLRLL